jgi:hypothetical protein
MAILTLALQADLLDRFGYIPTGLATAVSPLLAAQRDSFVLAWVRATREQHEQPANQWVLPEDQREAFERFRLTLLGASDE